MFLVFRVTIVSKGGQKRIRLCEKVEKVLLSKKEMPSLK